MAVNNRQIAENILAAVGGRENITSVTHCMTRLRFNLKDMGLPDQEQIKKLNGVLGVVVSGGQFQIIVGQNVPKVYAELCQMAGLQEQEAINENLDAPKEKLTPKKLGSNILNYLAGSMTPLIPILMAASMFKTFTTILGPTMLNVLSETSNLYILLDFLYDAGFYFLPIYIGYTAAKKIGASPVLGAYMGGILIAPDLLAIVSAGEPFTVLGIPMRLVSYTQSVLPIILSVAALYYVERLFKKIVPDAAAIVFVPTFTIFVMAPISLCLLAPLGSICSNYLAVILNTVAEYGGFIGKAVISAVWEFLVMTGMHTPLVLPAMATLMETGIDNLIFVCGKCAVYATIGMSIGAFFRLRGDERSASVGYLVSALMGGVTEPILYGIGLRYRRPFLGMIVGGLAGGAYAGIMGVAVHSMSPSNILSFTGFVGGSTMNLVNGIIALIISTAVSAAVTYVAGVESKPKAKA
ncbi:MAG TPA: PTS transporter subunit EIIC [Candidatus Faecalibacterium faecipullorum]|uniref:PTS transporter subunit EIIC n=1 Tax=Candidatus Faecalibacterium faecipullorum TaxID=2838578 RepID=A0A9D2S647_9FIRM|nr:PTS transporter subunit EIIC [Candidatus Faecalibacterium faecipullorum]